MKFFTKVALVSAMAISANAMAAQLQALDEEELSATTGQDGITITLNTSGIDIAHLYLHDDDGLGLGTAAVPGANPGDPNISEASWDHGLGGTTNAGAIGIHGVKLEVVDSSGNNVANGTLAKVLIDTDGGADAATSSDDAFLNVNVNTGNIKISLDSITVGASNDEHATNVRRGVKDPSAGNSVVKIVSGYTDTDKLAVTVGGSKLNIQLGNTPQGAMIKASGTVTGGLNIKNVALVDKAGGGVVGIDEIRVADAGQTYLTADAEISLINASENNSGLKIELGSTAQDIYLKDVRLGGNFTTTAGAALTAPADYSDATTVGTSAFNKAHIASIGNLELQGLNLNATSVIISGH